ncbi:MAG: HEAT repeat domain-containing protein [Rivularia sp. T60_A2020_040]|nr:HEAT repeat domain-containing protein [Rivularia sp. T60_A2020_040]
MNNQEYKSTFNTIRCGHNHALENSTNHNVRAAATILRDIGANNPDVVTALVNALKDEKEDVQYKAVTALEKIGFTAIDTFLNSLDS